MAVWRKGGIVESDNAGCIVRGPPPPLPGLVRDSRACAAFQRKGKGEEPPFSKVEKSKKPESVRPSSLLSFSFSFPRLE